MYKKYPLHYHNAVYSPFMLILKLTQTCVPLKYVAHYTGKNSYPLNHHTLLTCFVNMAPPLSKHTT